MANGTAMQNRDLRLEARGADVPLWKIAKALGIAQSTLFNQWREELPPEEKAKIRAIIAEIRESA